MFLPMSWTSPLTVAITTRPADFDAPGSFSASMYGTRWATAFFMTRALLTTWGRNILPGPEQVADDVHPVHQRALDDLDRALGGLPRLLGVLDDERVDALDEGVGQALLDRQLNARRGRRRPAARSCAPTSSATASSRSVASGRRLRTTSSTSSRSSGSMSS